MRETSLYTETNIMILHEKGRESSSRPHIKLSTNKFLPIFPEFERGPRKAYSRPQAEDFAAVSNML